MDKRDICKNKKILKYLLILVMGIIHVLVLLPRLNEQHFPIIYMDEVAYLSHAANFAGLDWRGLLSYPGASSYSFGYSLILSPLFLFARNIFDLYRMAIIINSLFCVGIFILLYLIGTKLNDFQISDIWIVLFSFCASMYSALVVYSRTTLSETVLCFFVLLDIYLFILYERSGKLAQGIVLAFSIVFTYAIHNRLIMVVVGYVLLILILKLQKKINWENMVFILGMLAISILLYYFVKRGIYHELEFNLTEDSNSINRRVNSLTKRFLDFAQYYGYLKSFFWKLWYVGIATFGLGFLGIYRAVKNIIASLWQRSKKKCDEESFTLSYFFIMLIFGSLFFLTVIYGNSVGYTSAGNVKIDPLIYGRYMECVMPVLILIGLIQMWSRKDKLKEFFMFFLPVNILFWFVGYRLEQYISSLGEFRIMRFQVVGIHIYRLFGIESRFGFSFFIITILSTLIWLIILIFTWIKENDFTVVVKASVVLAITFVFWQVGFSVVQQPILDDQEGIGEEYSQFTEIEQYICEKGFENIYAYDSGNIKSWILLQFVLWDKGIRIVENTDHLQSGVLIFSKEDYDKNIELEFKKLYEGEKYYILQIK